MSWLLLLYSLPTSRNSKRVNIWRKLQKAGALQIKTSTYLLPDRPAQYELFQWLSKQVSDAGGDATLVRAQEIEGLADNQIVELFGQAREKEYAELSKSLRQLRGSKTSREDHSEELAKLVRQFREIRDIDFFDSPRGQEIEAALQQLEQSNRAKGYSGPRLDAKHYRGKTWLTRPRPEIDRVASAWLIRRFIDKQAEFIFAPVVPEGLETIPYDMINVEFSHHGDDCTFETLTKRFGIDDKAIRKIAEMIHDADLNDGKFQRAEAIGIDRVLKGWAKLGLGDQQLLERGFECFDALYAQTK